MEKSWKEAIKRVLEESSTPLHYSEISEQILSRGYYKTDGATPAASVNAQITASIKHDGEKSLFIRVGKGVFQLKEANIFSRKDKVIAKQSAVEDISEAEIEQSDSIIRSLGMYWQRDLVVWRNDQKMYGKQQATSKPVDFGKQKGIYIPRIHTISAIAL